MADEPKLKDDQQLIELEPLAETKDSGGKGSRVSRRSFLSGLGAAGLIASATPLAQPYQCHPRLGASHLARPE